MARHTNPVPPLQRGLALSDDRLVALQESLELCAGEDRLGLFQSLDFLVTSRLADFKVLHPEVTTGMKFSFIVSKLLQLQHHCFLILFGLHQVRLRLCLRLGLVDDVLALGLNGTVRVLDEILIRLLSVLFRAASLSSL